MKRNGLLAALVLLSGCGTAVVPNASVPDASHAASPSGPSGSCGAATDSTLAFLPSAESLSRFMRESLAEFADRVPADRLTFPVDAEACGMPQMDVVDLYDLGNEYATRGDRVYFTSGHAYHVYAGQRTVSFSNIVFFEPDTMVVFEAVNCTDRGDTVDDAVAYLKARHPDLWSEAYEARIRTYREHGHYLFIDIEPGLLCTCEICFLPPSQQRGVR